MMILWTKEGIQATTLMIKFNMIKDKKTLHQFNKLYLRKRNYSYKKALEIYESLWNEAVNLKILPLKNPMEGIECCLRVAKILNSYKK